MKKTIIAASGILLSLLLQTTAFHYLAIWGVKPDLLMIWIVLMGLLCGQPSGFAVGAGGSLCLQACWWAGWGDKSVNALSASTGWSL